MPGARTKYLVCIVTFLDAGYFDDEDEAARAWDQAMLKSFGLKKGKTTESAVLP